MPLIHRLLNRLKPTVRLVDALRERNEERLAMALGALAAASPQTIVTQLNQLAELAPTELKLAWLLLQRVPFETLRPLLLAVGSKTAFEPLPPHAAEFDSLQDPIRVALLQAVGKAVTNPANCAPLLSDPDLAVRRSAIKALSNCFLEFTRDRRWTEDLDWRRKVIREAAESRAPLLQSCLSDPDPWVRTFALEGLKQTEGQMPIASIIPLLDDVVPHVRAAALSALASNEEEREAVQDICQHVQKLSRDPNKYVRSSVSHFYSMMVLAFPDLVQQYSAELELLSRDSYDRVRENARGALDKLVLKPSVPDNSARVQLGHQESTITAANVLLQSNQLLQFRADSQSNMEAQIAFTEALLTRIDAPSVRLVLFRCADPDDEFPWLLLKAGKPQALLSYAGPREFSDKVFVSLFGDQLPSITWADHIADNCPRPGEAVTEWGRQVYEKLVQDIRVGRYVIERVVKA